MPTKKANNKKGKSDKAPKDTRTPPEEVLLEFLKKNNLVLIADEISLPTTIIPDVIYVVDKRPRIRVYYSDQLNKLEEKVKEKIDIVN